MKKSLYGFRKLVWLLPTYVTYDEGEISAYQLRDEYIVQQFILFYFMAAKRGY
ncbi:unnamed protein product [Schistosoma margrebowiei]|uniref:Uncharacterized protein n=1 Tax=Schistosoma margrebowiei TaxID=48269 RepID=A0A3P7X5P2_9TREM|nr:unnamed protein product [Schistosoma margrebowiei]